MKWSLSLFFGFALLFFSCRNESSQTPHEEMPTDQTAAVDDLLDPTGDDGEKTDDLTDLPDQIEQSDQFDDILPDGAFDDLLSDDTLPDDLLPDNDTGPTDCQINSDCPFGSRCDTTLSPHECLPMSTCVNDLDCATYEKCAIVDNWKQCQVDLAPHQCDSEGTCGFGEVCEDIYGVFKVCRSLNECTTSDECLEQQTCESNGQYLLCVTVCQTDLDCGFGYRCEAAMPHNVCSYANECIRDSDCPSFNTCEAFGNWMKCTVNATGKFCSDDDGCDPAEYCDLLIGPVGGCKSRDQCHIDDDCGINLICQSNGVYYECVPETPKDCFIDQQCPSGWACSANNICVPPYAGVCPEVEGVWITLLSENPLVPQGMSYEFVPESGCTGKVVPKDQQFETGSFSQKSPGIYEVKMALFLTCEGQLTMATIMELTCPGGNATLVKGN